jgi:type IV secretory pathway VirB10-like protein
MRPIRTIMTTLMLTGLASLGYARPLTPVAAPSLSALTAAGNAAGSTPQQDEGKPQDQEKPKDTQDSKPADTAKPDTAKPEKPEKQAQPDKSQTPAAEKQDKSDKQQPDKSQAQENKDQQPDKNVAKQDQKEDTGHQANGGRIPDKDFKAHFGQEHKFSVKQVVTTTTIVPNQTRFVYTGYTFVFADPWPAGWAMDDDCYIDYVDGAYFLLDPEHPGVQIALTIVG